MEYRTAGAFFYAGLLFLAGLRLTAEPAAAELATLFTGTWTDAESLDTRGELRLKLNPVRLDLRLLELSRSTAETAGDLGDARFFPGIYHRSSESRLLYGPLRAQGLATRLSDPWNRGPAYADARLPSSADLDTEAAPSRDSATFLGLGTPREAPTRAYLNTMIEADRHAQIIAGAESHAGDAGYGRVEALYAPRRLEARQPDTWFAAEPPLPARDASLYALGFLLRGPALALGADGAISTNFAEGIGSYGSAALRLGAKPWSVSAVLDGADQRFRGGDGELAGQALRAALRLDRTLKGGGLVRVSAVRRVQTPAEELTTAEFTLRWPSPGKPRLLRPLSVGLAWDREGRDVPTDAASATLGAALGPLRAWFSASAVVGPENVVLDSCRTSVSTRIGPLRLRGALGSGCGEEGAPPAYDASLSLGLDLPWGSLSFRLSADPLPGPASWTFAWRLSGGFP